MLTKIIIHNETGKMFVTGEEAAQYLLENYTNKESQPKLVTVKALVNRHLTGSMVKRVNNITTKKGEVKKYNSQGQVKSVYGQTLRYLTLEEIQEWKTLAGK